MRFSLCLVAITVVLPCIAHSQAFDHHAGPGEVPFVLNLSLDGNIGQDIGPVVPFWLVAPQSTPDLPRIFLGSALGLAGGGAAGAGLGYLIYQLSDPPDGDMFGGVFTVAAGAALGGAIGGWAGVRWANDSRGNPWITAAGSVVGVAGGVGLGLLLGDATESTFVGLAVAIPIAITLPALAEYFTTPR